MKGAFTLVVFSEVTLVNREKVNIFEKVDETQHRSVTVSKGNTSKLWQLRVLAVTTSGIWAASTATQLPSLQTSAGDDWLADEEEPQPSDAAAEPRVLLPWPPPQLLSLRPSATQGLEAHISWRSNYDQDIRSDEKFELTWRLDDAAIDLTGRLYTSETDARFPVMPASTYTVFVRRLDASGGSVATSEVLFLDTSTSETEARQLHSSTDYKFAPGYLPEKCGHLQCGHPSSCRLACGYNERVPGLQVALKEASSPDDGTYFVFDLRSS
ncbi:hypothetical protein HPB49_021855 [Dermacentor silvarum]|uniref:Uncharacterized protein n=1 Tax=Dermacentor silvarum TaxID=543639 RepID=A0ACB8CHH1_DERSI|nr:hypothetical protein HPB49_021855 [Dermacentor silvarum]